MGRRRRRQLEGASAVEVAEPDTYAEPTAVPNDPLFGDQWPLQNLGTGYRFDSPDLGPVAWEDPGEPGVHGWDFVGEDAEAPTEDADPTDSDLISGGHGVHTAGIIGAAGNNGIGITGSPRTCGSCRCGSAPTPRR